MQEALEAEIRAHHDAGDMEAAATVALEGYGREILGYLVATMRNEDAASEVFAQLGEDLWKGLPGFAWRSSFRTWIYTLARHAASQYRRSPDNQTRRRAPLSRIGDVAERVRTRTLPHLRTEVKDRFAELRETLDPDDQALLILRINRRMSWTEIAQVFAADEELDEEGLRRASARHRQRLRQLKAKMRNAAKKQGLIDSH